MKKEAVFERGMDKRNAQLMGIMWKDGEPAVVNEIWDYMRRRMEKQHDCKIKKSYIYDPKTWKKVKP